MLQHHTIAVSREAGYLEGFGIVSYDILFYILFTLSPWTTTNPSLARVVSAFLS